MIIFKIEQVDDDDDYDEKWRKGKELYLVVDVPTSTYSKILPRHHTIPRNVSTQNRNSPTNRTTNRTDHITKMGQKINLSENRENGKIETKEKREIYGPKIMQKMET